MIDTKETKRLTSKWSEFYERPINEKEFDEISMNLGKFFSILSDWDTENNPELSKNPELVFLDGEMFILI